MINKSKHLLLTKARIALGDMEDDLMCLITGNSEESMSIKLSSMIRVHRLCDSFISSVIQIMSARSNTASSHLNDFHITNSFKYHGFIEEQNTS